MQVASRPRLHTGIALVGASVIAVCPLAPSMPDIHLPSVQSAAVKLAATTDQLVNPIEQWAQVIQTTIANLGQLGQQLAADPAPILQQIIANQSANAAILGNAAGAASTAITTALQSLPAALQSAATQLTAGDVTGAVTALTGPVLPLVLGLIDAGFTGADAWQAVVNTTQNFANAVAAVPKLVLSGLLAVASPLISDINASAAIGQAVVDAVRTGDLAGVVTALVNAPATLTGATLNGFGTLPGIGTPVGGLLSGVGAIPGLTDGLISGLLSLRDTIAAALAPQAAVAAALAPQAAVATAASIPNVAAKTVTLTAPSATKAIEAPATKAAKDGTDTSATDGTTSTSSTSSTDATDSSASSATSTKGDTGTKSDPASSTSASGSSTAGDTSTKGDTGT
ncbi:MAG: hypothetical protein QOG37_1581, partial [Mycobacterium sp.]|nr:hypothetical protein [Mycobacterium sp.]